ncbi:MAG: Holliday junction resolvase RuvX [Candidatus Kerfeldbacteria bacterium]|nr:Holliday junction resolvase RuvX [Candidatus Kerfeldbacteria bacterium]
MGRVLGIDYGTKRIGTALSDEAKHSAFPHTILSVTHDADAVRQLKQLIDSEDIDGVVIGLPLDQNGDEGLMAGRVRQFGEQLGQVSHHSIAYQDERMTSRISQQRMQTHTTTRTSRGALDAIAAQEILQTYLERTYGPAEY